MRRRKQCWKRSVRLRHSFDLLSVQFLTPPVDQKDTQAREQARKIEVLQDGLQDYENTIQQFRELVLNLQAYVSLILHLLTRVLNRRISDLDALREQNQVQQNEYQTSAAQSAAVMSLNMRLQSSALKSQVKNIDFEIRKLESRQAKEMLEICQVGREHFTCDNPSVVLTFHWLH
jgi:dynactin 1